MGEKCINNDLKYDLNKKAHLLPVSLCPSSAMCLPVHVKCACGLCSVCVCVCTVSLKETVGSGSKRVC